MKIERAGNEAGQKPANHEGPPERPRILEEISNWQTGKDLRKLTSGQYYAAEGDKHTDSHIDRGHPDRGHTDRHTNSHTDYYDERRNNRHVDIGAKPPPKPEYTDRHRDRD